MELFLSAPHLVLALDPVQCQDGLLVPFAARLHQTRGMAKADEQLRSARLHVVDDDVVMATVDGCQLRQPLTGGEG